MKKIKKILISTSALVALALVPAAVVACSSSENSASILKPNTQGYYTVDGYQVKLDESNNTAELIGHIENNYEQINLPSQLVVNNKDYTVTKIGDYFGQISNGTATIESIPDTITYIGTEAFIIIIIIFLTKIDYELNSHFFWNY